MKIFGYLTAAAAVLVLSSCAVGNRYAYHDVTADLPVRGGESVAVATLDQRPYVLSGEKTPQFVGLMRGGFGNPFNVTTRSGKSLADDMSASIASSLQAKGFRAEALAVPHAATREDAIDSLRQTGARRLLLLSLPEWKSDSYADVTVKYEMRFDALDPAGNVLGNTSLKGTETEMLKAFYTGATVSDAVRRVFAGKLAEAFSDPEIVKALSP